MFVSSAMYSTSLILFYVEEEIEEVFLMGVSSDEEVDRQGSAKKTTTNTISYT
jgi:hypothetical protein